MNMSKREIEPHTLSGLKSIGLLSGKSNVIAPAIQEHNITMPSPAESHTGLASFIKGPEML